MPTPEPHNPNDMASFAQHWASSQDLVRLYVESVVWDLHAGEDIVQQVAFQAGRNYAQFDAARPFSAWAIGIARNEVRMYLRKHARDRHVFNDEMLGLLADTVERHRDDFSPRSVALRECMKAVPESGITLLQMRYSDNLSGQELSKRLGISQNAVLLRLSRLRSALAKCIEDRLSKGRDLS